MPQNIYGGDADGRRKCRPRAAAAAARPHLRCLLRCRALPRAHAAMIDDRAASMLDFAMNRRMSRRLIYSGFQQPDGCSPSVTMETPFYDYLLYRE